MIRTIFFLLTGMILILGLISLFESVLKWLYLNQDSNRENKFLILPLRGRQEDIEYTIRRIISLQNFNPSNYRVDIICIDLGLDNETKKICSLLSRDYSSVHFLNF